MADRVGNGRLAQTQGYRRRSSEPTPMRRQEWRKNKSTIVAITNLIYNVVEGLERRENVVSIFLDLSKAFDCVHHATLLHQLWSSGIRGVPHD
ncbi:hypothetical protein J6590_087916 [Homalodisca vitripennis]|nr:hypothetical protein J6590_087916 [Homalodisca vitripennis]